MPTTMNEADFLRNLALSFLRDMMGQLKVLESKISRDSKDELTAFGHTLKGSAAMFGFTEISELGIRLEEDALAEHWDGVRATAAALKSVLSKKLD